MSKDLLWQIAAHADPQTVGQTINAVTETFLSQVGTALAIIFLVAVSTEILIETIRGLLSGLFRWRNSPFFTSQTDFKTALKSVADMMPEKESEAFAMIARLETAHQKAKTLSEKKAKEVEDLIELAEKNETVAGMKKAIHTDLSRIISEIEMDDRQRLVWIKTLAGGVGVLMCLSADINAFAEIGIGEEGHVGEILTGLAAAGGSTFWHEQVERVRLIRAASRGVTTTNPA